MADDKVKMHRGVAPAGVTKWVKPGDVDKHLKAGYRVVKDEEAAPAVKAPAKKTASK